MYRMIHPSLIFAYPFCDHVCRDKFYELLREWQEHHFTPGWSMSEQQGDRIQDISTKVPIVNQIHFTRLFVLELIHVCQGDITHLGDRDGWGGGGVLCLACFVYAAISREWLIPLSLQYFLLVLYNVQV